MSKQLELFRADLGLTVRTLCRHLRNKEYKNPDEEGDALYSLANSQLLVDELNSLISNYKGLIKTLELHLDGQETESLDESEVPPTIHECCLYYLERAECPLGSTTDELKSWVESYADRQQLMSQAFSKFFPGLTMLTPETNEQGETVMRPASEPEKFDSQTRSLLRTIEQSNALDAFNERMKRVHGLLKAEADLAYILAVLKTA